MNAHTAPLPFSARPDPAAALISVVIPFFNEAGAIDAVCDRLVAVLERLGCRWEIIGVDDGSRDDGFVRMAARAKADARIKVVRFARNFGKEAAIQAGLHHADGDAVVVMDADLQHPPELIGEFLSLWRAGFQIVQGVRDSRRDQTWLRRFLSFLFYRVFRSLSDVDIPDGATDFCLMDRTAADAVRSMPEQGRFFKGLIRWVGFRHIKVPFQPAERAGGCSVWTLRRLVSFGIDGIFAFSRVPLQLWLWIGVAMAILAAGQGVYVALAWLFGADAPGTSAMMLLAGLVFSALNLLAVGTLGEYLGRVLTETRRRPTYVVAERFGLGKPTAGRAADGEHPPYVIKR